MEEGIFPQPAVAGALSNYVEARLHYDGPRGEQIKEFQQQMVGRLGWPIYVIVDPVTGNKVDTLVGATRDPDKFLRFLRAAP